MMADKQFKIAFLFSIGLHSVLFTPLLSFIPHPNIKDNTHIEVTYVHIKEEKVLDTKPIPLKDRKSTIQKEKKQLLEEKKELLKEKALKEDIEQNEVKPALRKIIQEIKSLQKKLAKEASMGKRTIHLNSVSIDDGESEAQNYLIAIRSRINRFVHRNYNPSMGRGEALIYFILDSDGYVQSATIVKDDLGKNERLRSLCLDSVYLSSPFKPFPEDLDMPEASFNISISFMKR